MKTFKDLIFKKHPLALDLPDDFNDRVGFRNMVQAVIEFDNGIMSVVKGGPTYSNGIDTYEVMDCDGEVYSQLTEDEVTELMVKQQTLFGSIPKFRMLK